MAELSLWIEDSKSSAVSSVYESKMLLASAEVVVELL